MCQRVQCGVCGKPTFAGCGAHVEQVLRDVPLDARCRCREARAKTADRKAHAPQASWLRKLVGK